MLCPYIQEEDKGVPIASYEKLLKKTFIRGRKCLGGRALSKKNLLIEIVSILYSLKSETCMLEILNMFLRLNTC